MKNVVPLLLAVGALVAGWMNRDDLGGWWAKFGGRQEAVSSTRNLPPPGTPHPAREAQARAKALYPGLAIANSPLNKKFVALYKDSLFTDPALLSRPDWPLALADRAAVLVGGAPMPRGTPGASVPQARTGKQVVIYTTAHCPYCKQAKQYLAQKGVSYREVDVETSISGKEEYRKLGGNGVPLIMVGDQKVEGFSATALDRLLL